MADQARSAWSAHARCPLQESLSLARQGGASCGAAEGIGFADAARSAARSERNAAGWVGGQARRLCRSRRLRRPPVSFVRFLNVGLIRLDQCFRSLPDIVGRVGEGDLPRAGLAAAICWCNSSIKLRSAPLARRGFAERSFISFISAVVGNSFSPLFVDFSPSIN